jgi:phosphoglycolate phosphatase
MIKLVIMDFDDTLTMSEEVCFALENRIAEMMGYPAMSRAAHRGNWGQPIEKAIVERIPGIDADRFMELHRKIWPEFLRAGKLDAVDGNIETLKLLKESGKDLAILTARSLYTVEHLFDENHCIAKYVEKIYHLGNVRYQKPDPRVFGQILEDFKTGPQEAVYVGDSISDGICAKGAGLHFIATLESGLRSKEDFKPVPVDFFANRFPEIVDYINPSR